MKLLIAISTCEAYELLGVNDAARKTWLPQAAENGFDVRFFIGTGGTPHEGTELLDVPDDYNSLCYKTHACLRWAVKHDYAFVFSSYPDTYIRPERLRNSGFEQYDY